jgi:hypothetical protein
MLIISVGCKNEVEVQEEKDKVEVVQKVEKIDKNKDYVEVIKYRGYLLDDNQPFDANYLSVNLNSEVINNLNMTLKNNVIVNSKTYVMVGDREVKLTKGNLINYEYFISGKYLSIIETTYQYNAGQYRELKDMVYVVDIDYGKLFDNDGLLREFQMTSSDVIEKIRNSGIPDADYIAMYVRNNGYKLYIDKNGKLVVNYLYENDNVETKNELVLN